MKTSEKPGYEPFPEISGSPSNCLCVAHFVKDRLFKDPNDIDFITTIFEDKKRNVRVPTVGSMRTERRAKRVKSREEGEDALATADGLVGCTGDEQSAWVKLPPGMHLVSQILGHTVWVERAV